MNLVWTPSRYARVLLTVAVCVTGCGSSGGGSDGPTGVAERFMAALSDGEFATVCELASAAFRTSLDGVGDVQVGDYPDREDNDNCEAGAEAFAGDGWTLDLPDATKSRTTADSTVEVEVQGSGGRVVIVHLSGGNDAWLVDDVTEPGAERDEDE